MADDDKHHGLMIAFGMPHQDGGGDEGDHDGHEAEHAAVRQLASAFGVDLPPEKEQEACEALQAFLDAREGEPTEEESEMKPEPNG